MEVSKQDQKAGDNSTQIQATTINITNIVGIDDQRAREICREEYSIAKQNWTSEAYEIADSRVRQFEDKLMPRMVQYDSSLKFFADPAFQFTLRMAQIKAASSEREDDYDLLTELLVNRVDQDTDRKRRLGIVKAIDVVDQIDEIALIGLSIVYAVSFYTPVSPILSKGLKALDEFYGKILMRKQLPSGDSWLTHLDLLSTIRILDRSTNHLKKLEQYIPKKFDKYLTKGIKEDSEEYNSIKERFAKVGLNTSCFVNNEIKEGYLIWGVNKDVDQLKIVQQIGIESVVHIPLNDEQKKVMREAISMTCEDGTSDVELLNAFWKEWDKYENLATVHKWWNSIVYAFDVTPVGAALANAYIRGKDPTVPNLY